MANRRARRAQRAEGRSRPPAAKKAPWISPRWSERFERLNKVRGYIAGIITLIGLIAGIYYDTTPVISAQFSNVRRPLAFPFQVHNGSRFFDVSDSNWKCTIVHADGGQHLDNIEGSTLYRSDIKPGKDGLYSCPIEWSIDNIQNLTVRITVNYKTLFIPRQAVKEFSWQGRSVLSTCSDCESDGYVARVKRVYQ
jgi:hypothetical protein